MKIKYILVECAVRGDYIYNDESVNIDVLVSAANLRHWLYPTRGSIYLLMHLSFKYLIGESACVEDLCKCWVTTIRERVECKHLLGVGAFQLVILSFTKSLRLVGKKSLHFWRAIATFLLSPVCETATIPRGGNSSRMEPRHPSPQQHFSTPPQWGGSHGIPRLERFGGIPWFVSPSFTWKTYKGGFQDE